MDIVQVLEGKDIEIQLKLGTQRIINGAYIDVYKDKEKIDIFTEPYLSGDSIFFDVGKLKKGNYIFVTRAIVDEKLIEIKTQVNVKPVV